MDLAGSAAVMGRQELRFSRTRNSGLLKLALGRRTKQTLVGSPPREHSRLMP
jgi:hypothetical protein